MTDKEIIIDGVDVSECDMRCENKDCALYYAELNNDKGELIYGFNCEDNPNCIYKQLQRARAENERLKEELATYGATGVCEVCSDKANKLADKYLGCLQEIKDIADAKCNECKYGKGGISCKYGDCGEAKLHLITQLITKAEEE